MQKTLGGGLGLLGLRVAGAGLLIATGAIHLDLYLTGYRTIPTIGGLFLFQVAAAFVLAAAVLGAAVLGAGVLGTAALPAGVPPAGVPPANGPAADGLASRGWLADALGAGFGAATLGGYLLSVWVGLFGFKEVRTTSGIVAGIIEVLVIVVLGGAAILAGRRAGLMSRVPAAVGRAALPGLGAVSVIAVVLLAVVLAGAPGTAPAPAAASGPAVVKAARIGGETVLVNARGFTLYRFVPDGNGTSTCYGSCAAYWPPVSGPASAGPGVTGRLGTTTRTGGSTQATYDGHPLYTYVGDSGPGQNHGNGINLNGGLWLEVKVSG